MPIQKVLIVDDELIMRNFLRDTLKRKKIEITLAEDGKEAIQKIEKESFDLIITDLKMPHKNGIEVLKTAKELHPHILVIIMTAFGTIENAVEAIKLGAFHYLIKPFSPESIETILEKAQQHLHLVHENRSLRHELSLSSRGHTFIAESPSMKKIQRDIEKISKSNASIFITGESGTGKEVVAQAIHESSLRKTQPFIKVNCAAIPETLIESEFFGHEKGAFTGANIRKEGRFEIANRGTLLLDEITEIPTSLQPKLLRAVQELEFERVGGIHPIHVDIRFIATTNRNIQNAIQEGHFREDLFYRLHVVPIHIPPLRDRPEDILALSQYFLSKFCIENHKSPKTLSQEAIQKLVHYPWPGNVRELANILERTIVMDFGEIVTADHLLIERVEKEETRISDSISLAEMERRLILSTLKRERFNRIKTAKILGIHTRTLRNKLKEYEKNKQQKLF